MAAVATPHRSRSRAVLCVLMAGAVAVALGLTQPPDAAADHTPVPGSVALVGSLQDELGCPIEWMPECVATELAPLDGSPGVFRATFDVPAGGYEYKVALNDGWEENYGAGGAPGGANIAIEAPGGPITFTYDHATHVISDDLPVVLGDDSEAQWLRRGIVAWDLPDERAGFTYRLFSAPQGGLEIVDAVVVGGSSFPMQLDPAGLPASVLADFPHLASYEALGLPDAARAKAEALLTGQLAVASYDDSGALVDATGVQVPGVLDDIYHGAGHRKLGVTWVGSTPRLAVWAPTAKRVHLLIQTPHATSPQRLVMRRNADGVWTRTGKAGWKGARYLYDVRVFAPTEREVVSNLVTDPYSIALTTNSTRSVIANLDDPALAPNGWRHLAKPTFVRPEDALTYELHVRDFSIDDETVPAAHRGGFLAFTDRSSDGMTHLRSLARAGASFVQVLPAFDFATVPERRADQQAPACDLASFPPDSEEQQACVEPVRPTDGFNWGYDPWHYTAPEGSYALDQSGAGRTKEFRSMVAGINRAGLRMSMDVVYNHTSASGQDPKSVLDRIVPGYYHRLNPTGQVETSTCCANTASEHRMMQKLMTDSVVTWARDYKVDAFRFDLMGHHSKANMLHVRHALDALTLAKDGVDVNVPFA